MGFFDFLFSSAGAASRGSVSQETEKKISYDWDTVRALLLKRGPSDLKQALITADRCMDTALRDIAVGETMGERLKNSRDKFDPITYQKIWEAHKLRNNISHEAGFEPPHFMVTEAINNLQRALQTLGLRV